MRSRSFILVLAALAALRVLSMLSEAVAAEDAMTRFLATLSPGQWGQVPNTRADGNRNGVGVIYGYTGALSDNRPVQCVDKTSAPNCIDYDAIIFSHNQTFNYPGIV